MNKSRRAEVKKIMEKLREEVSSLIDEAREGIENVFHYEQEAYDNLPENLQYSERGEDMERCLEALDDMISFLDEDWYELDDKISELYEELEIEED